MVAPDVRASVVPVVGARPIAASVGGAIPSEALFSLGQFPPALAIALATWGVPGGLGLAGALPLPNVFGWGGKLGMLAAWVGG